MRAAVFSLKCFSHGPRNQSTSTLNQLKSSDTVPHSFGKFKGNETIPSIMSKTDSTALSLKSSGSFLFKLLLTMNKGKLFFLLLISIVIAFLEVGCIFLLKEVIDIYKADNIDKEKLLTYSGALVIMRLCISLISKQNEFQLFCLGFKTYVTLANLIVKKVLRIKPGASGDKFDEGKIISLLQNDADKLEYNIQSIPNIFGLPIKLILYNGLLFWYFGLTYLAGLATLFFFLLSMFLIQKLRIVYDRNALSVTDKRLKATSNVIGSLKSLKFYGWEEKFINTICKLRDNELDHVNSRMNAMILAQVLSWESSVAIAAASLIAYIYFSSSKNTTFIVASLSVFSLLQDPIDSFTYFLSTFGDVFVSFDRLNKLLVVEEVQQNEEAKDKFTVEIENGFFNWGEGACEGFELKDINLKLEKGQKVAVVGEIGAGKSSLLNAILGNLNKSDKTILKTVGNIAYVAQNPWITNDSVQENIVQDRDFDEETYFSVISLVNLNTDIFSMELKDHTLCGAKGSNLSGGQRARIALARAIYKEADMYLLDNPLGALDVKIGNKILNNVIFNDLKDKTVVVVTHNMEHASKFDYVITMKGGKIESIDEGSSAPSFVVSRNSSYVPWETKRKKQRTIHAKINNEGLNLNVFINFMQFMRGFAWNLVVVFFVILMILAKIFNDFWIVTWAGKLNKKEISDSDTDWYMYIYGSIAIAAIIPIFLRVYILKLNNINLAKVLHHKAIAKILKAPVSFLDSVNKGEIMNKLSDDLRNIERIYSGYIKIIDYTFEVIGILVICAIIEPLSIITFPFVVVVFGFVVYRFMNDARLLKQLVSSTKGPIIEVLSEITEGQSFIRLDKTEEYFLKKFTNKLETNFVLKLHQIANRCFYFIRLDLIAICFLIVLFGGMFYLKDSFSFGSVGVLLGYSLRMQEKMYNLALNFGWFQQSFIAFERIFEFWSFPKEKLAVGTNDEELEAKGVLKTGRIEFKNFSCWYPKSENASIKKINLSIEPRTKLGLVGRTGSGKSTLFLNLFRILDRTEGELLMDGVNINEIGLSYLKKNIAIIPQVRY